MKNLRLLFHAQKIKLSLSMCLILLTAGCKDPSPYIITCQDGEISFERICCNLNLKNINDSKQFTSLVIQSQAELEHYVVAFRQLPEIDFTRKTLLAGLANSNTQAKLVKQELIADCDSNKIQHTVFQQYGAAAITGKTT